MIQKLEGIETVLTTNFSFLIKNFLYPLVFQREGKNRSLNDAGTKPYYNSPFLVRFSYWR